jgi:hypothetical protein
VTAAVTQMIDHLSIDNTIAGLNPAFSQHLEKRQ